MLSDRLLDTHCHLPHYSDPVAIMEQAKQAQVDVVAVTNSPSEYRRFAARLGAREGVEVALGLHPLQVDSRWPQELLRLLRLLPRATWIGEVGLDLSPQGKPTERAQRAFFDALLAEAQVRGRPITVHNRGAADPVRRALASAGCHAVLHWVQRDAQGRRAGR